MRLVQEYEHHAKECRKMAAEAAPSQRLTITHMAEAWERLAADRRKLLASPAKIPKPDEG